MEKAAMWRREFGTWDGGWNWHDELGKRELGWWNALGAVVLLALWYLWVNSASLLAALGLAKPVVWCRKTNENLELLSRLPLLAKPYLPSLWVLNPLGGHLQSILFATFYGPRYGRAISRLRQRRVIIQSSVDGGTFALDWWDMPSLSPPVPSDAPVILVLPGVVGTSSNSYIRRTAAHMASHMGARTVAKAWRGLGCAITTKRPETWDEMAVQDTLDAIRSIRSEIGPHVPIIGVGYSYGGTLLQTLAGRVDASEHTLCGIVNVSGLFDWACMMRHIARSAGFYDFVNARVTVRNYSKFGVFDALAAGSGGGAANPSAPAAADAAAACCPVGAGVAAVASAAAAAAAPVQQIVNSQQELSPPPPLVQASASSGSGGMSGSCGNDNGTSSCSGSGAATEPQEWTPLSQEQMASIKDHLAFHTAVTIPFSGDATVEAYNERLEQLQLSAIEHVKVPVLALLAEDDPLCPPLAWNRALDAASQNPVFIVVVTRHGGHCGFFQGVFVDSWLDVLVDQYARALVEMHREGANNSEDGHGKGSCSIRGGSNSSGNVQEQIMAVSRGSRAAAAAPCR